MVYLLNWQITVLLFDKVAIVPYLLRYLYISLHCHIDHPYSAFCNKSPNAKAGEAVGEQILHAATQG